MKVEYKLRCRNCHTTFWRSVTTLGVANVNAALIREGLVIAIDCKCLGEGVHTVHDVIVMAREAGREAAGEIS